jgi:cytoskeletal protein CcmA (bactofilin family)
MLGVSCPTCGGNHEGSAECLFALDERFGDRWRAGLVSGWQPRQESVACFDCGTHLNVAVGAQSTMCKKCSSYIDLCDYNVEATVYKRFRTAGCLTVAERAAVHDTDALVGDAILKGRFIGKLKVQGSLTLYSTAQIKGKFKADKLVIPAGELIRWPGTLEVGSADVSGEVVGDLRAAASIVLRPTARLFGNIRALHLVVERGAVFVGSPFTGPAHVTRGLG